MPAASNRAHPHGDHPDRDGRFADHVVTAVVRHMNEDHATATAVIVRAFGGPSHLDAAEVTSVDATGLTCAVHVGGTVHSVRVPFVEPVTERAGLREAITRLFHAASTATAQPPRETS